MAYEPSLKVVHAFLNPETRKAAVLWVVCFTRAGADLGCPLRHLGTATKTPPQTFGLGRFHNARLRQGSAPRSHGAADDLGATDRAAGSLQLIN